MADRIRVCLARADAEALSECLDELHPNDLADVMEDLAPAERLDLLRLTDAGLAAASVDDGDRLLGQITWDDVMDVLEEETEDLLRFSGTDPSEPVRGGWWHAVRSRLPWLFLNLVTGSLRPGSSSCTGRSSTA